MKKSISLIEVIFTFAILTVIGTILVAFVSNSYSIYNRGQYVSQTQTEADTLTTRMANVLRGAYEVTAANSTSITFLSYYAPADTTPTQVTITKNNQNIVLATTIGTVSGSNYVFDPSDTVTRTICSHFVTNPATPLFQYASETGALSLPISLPAVHLITVTSTIFSTYKPSYYTTATTKINLRNLKTNL